MVEITDANMREAGQAAERLLNDPFLTEALNEIVGINTERAIAAALPEEREKSRQMVLAVDALRTELKSVFEYWKSAPQRAQAARARE
jgi:hypothetical protein